MEKIKRPKGYKRRNGSGKSLIAPKRTMGTVASKFIPQEEGSQQTQTQTQQPRSILDDDGEDDGELQILTKEGFEENIKLVTNNKITNDNTWKVPIIDYFYDMNHMRSMDGVSIDFHVASTTLDGCMKVISKRVDLVAKDTYELVMLDDAFNTATVVSVEEDEEMTKIGETSMIKTEDDELEKSFLNIKDEGKDSDQSEKKMNVTDPKADPTFKIENDVQILNLIDSFRPTIESGEFQNATICDEIKDIKSSVENLDYGTEYLNKLNERRAQDLKEESDEFPEFKVEYDYDIDNFDLNDPNQGNNGINNEAVSFDLPEDTEYNSGLNGVGDEVSFGNGQMDIDEESYNVEDIIKKETLLMKELDKRGNSRKRQSYWKIRALNSKSGVISSSKVARETENTEKGNGTVLQKHKKVAQKPEKSQYVIDFMNDTPDSNSNVLFVQRNAKPVPLNKVNVELTTIPDEKTWSSERLVTAFIKPKRRFRNIFTKKSTSSRAALYADREFWAAKYNDKEVMPSEEIDEDVADFLYDVMDKTDSGGKKESPHEDNLPDFANEFDAGGYDFDAPMEDNLQSQSQSTPGAKTETIPARKSSSWHQDQIHYERRSKKINIRALKKNIWDVTQEQVSLHPDLRLSEIVKDTYERYEGQERNELSTSFFFICMLHIANEEGLSIDKTDNLDDLIIHAQPSSTPIL
ncbi:Condensin complex subunit 2 [Pichia kudriavzevii]|uniref:Condensin complex subunit 2 n=1 Tax=Pichia kudriavzevii TaxID=4909 RepID=A0A1V2LLY1_PICKU|nr:Condensin complex subunit 2 [Pichia kudriavzevii]